MRREFKTLNNVGILQTTDPALAAALWGLVGLRDGVNADIGRAGDLWTLRVEGLPDCGAFDALVETARLWAVGLAGRWWE